MMLVAGAAIVVFVLIMLHEYRAKRRHDAARRAYYRDIDRYAKHRLPEGVYEFQPPVLRTADGMEARLTGPDHPVNPARPRGLGEPEGARTKEQDFVRVDGTTP